VSILFFSPSLLFYFFGPNAKKLGKLTFANGQVKILGLFRSQAVSVSQIKTILPALSPSHLTFSNGKLIKDQEFELRLKLNTGKELDTHTFQTSELEALRQTLIQIRQSNPGIEFSPDLIQFMNHNLKPSLKKASLTRKIKDLTIAILFVILFLPIVIFIFYTLGEFIRPN